MGYRVERETVVIVAHGRFTLRGIPPMAAESTYTCYLPEWMLMVY